MRRLRDSYAVVVVGTLLVAATAAGGSAHASPVLPELPAAGPDVRAALRTDPTVAVDRRGAVWFADVAPPSTEVRTRPLAVAPAPVTVFDQHSLPGSAHTIYLDFDGVEVSGTVWNTRHGLAAGAYPGWDRDGSPGFGPGERAAILSIWKRVAEDFAPFDVDVTTEDPGLEALDRSGADDTTYGTRVVITNSRLVNTVVCPLACSGLAYYDVVDLAVDHELFQPAWVFPRALRQDPKLIADGVSHELGHQLGLVHDGTAEEGYYSGHGSWAPIMGSGSSRPIVQWSRGDYPGANNQQDDLALIAANGLPLRPDDAGADVADAAPAWRPTGAVADDADVVVHALGTCTGPVEVVARTLGPSPDLDIRLTLLDAAGSSLAVADPPSRRLGYDRAGGLAARLEHDVAPGAYYVAVEGVGAGSPLTSYDGYASLGRYRLAVSGCRSLPGGR